MLKLSCHVSKKVPIPGQDYSSQSFACGIEAELADAADAPALKAKAEELFNLVQRVVENEIAKASAAAAREPVAASDGGNSQHRSAPQTRAPRVPQDGGNGNGRARRNGQPVMATAAQARAIKSIAAEQGLDLAEILAPYKVADVEGLSIRDASKVIDALKARKGNGNRR